MNIQEAMAHFGIKDGLTFVAFNEAADRISKTLVTVARELEVDPEKFASFVVYSVEALAKPDADALKMVEVIESIPASPGTSDEDEPHRHFSVICHPQKPIVFLQLDGHSLHDVLYNLSPDGLCQAMQEDLSKAYQGIPVSEHPPQCECCEETEEDADDEG